MKIKWLLIAALCSSIVTSGTGLAAEMEIGDVVGQVLSTDIQAVVNGSPIPSMNVNGYTAVVAEDLRQYGFDVAWIPQRREIVIHNVAGKQPSPLPVSPSSPKVGEKLADVLYTDIAAYYGDTKIPSYNIGGKTAVLLNDLEPFGQVSWSEQERKLSFSPAPGSGKGARTANTPLAIHQKESIAIEGIAIGDETITYEDSEIGRIVEGRPMVSVTWLAERLGYRTERAKDGKLYVKSGTYSFNLQAGNTKAERFWFGSPAADFELYVEPKTVNGELLAFETDLKHLFGYYSVWSPETRALNIDYRNYEVEDYGLSESPSSYNYYVFADEYVSGYAGVPSLYVTSRINGGERGGGGGGGASGSGMDDGPKYRFGSGAPIDFGRNELEVSLVEDGRLLFYKTLVVNLTMHDVDSIIDYNGPFGFGNYSVLKRVDPERAYLKTSAAELEFSGQIDSKVGSGLTFTVEKQEGDGFRKVSDATAPFDEDTFHAKLSLPEEPGLYRITAVSMLTNPRYSSSIAVAKWYVDKQ
ncbi:hypothetical protein ACFQI7_24955 [Paenibacillus allorhizosphaerae]|uniref:Copper amine oxidase-like N-terminal domain-containing protein n=1 Tax=Paenibacillus allorhizosphaerae TaxID=2849866 RepID=A0ABM8VJ32_9BACL|nr:hypothetical protein [Paenibacillus allorhizosphaerae]CAG7644854.1 hypothetical protein PAECIP111802_03366 [Paenibacillus allorhizosphaerae]